MSRNNTGNPIGSKAFPDFEDNVKNLELAVNSNEMSWRDRFGRTRTTLSGYDARFYEFLVSSGYQFIADYGAGIEITEYNQLVRDENGEFWRLSGQVELPYTTTGAGIPEDDALVPAGDAVLRQDLANPDMGAEMVAVGDVPTHVAKPSNVAESIGRLYRTGVTGIFDTSAYIPSHRAGELTYVKKVGGAASLLTDLERFFPEGAFVDPAITADLAFVEIPLQSWTTTSTPDVYRSQFAGWEGPTSDGLDRYVVGFVIDKATGRKYTIGHPGSGPYRARIDTTPSYPLRVEFSQPPGVTPPDTLYVCIGYEVSPSAQGLRSVYIDPEYGSDFYPGTSFSWAVKTFTRAWELDPDVIFIRPGIYDMDNWPGTISGTKDISIRCVGGIATMIPRPFAFSSWVQHSGDIYRTSIAGSRTPVGVVDLEVLDGYGLPTTLDRVESLGMVTPGTFYYDSTTREMYVNRMDGRAATNSSVVPYSTGSLLRHSAPGVKLYAENLNLISGTGGAISARDGDIDSVLICKNVRAIGSYNSNGFDIQDIGLSIAIRCMAVNNFNDGFNYTGANGLSPHFVEIDCIGSGSKGGGTSNGSTSHNSCVGFRIGTDVSGNRGPGFADVNDAITYNVNCTSHSNGPDANAGGFQAEGNAVVYIDGASAFNNSGEDFMERNGGRVFVRDVYGETFSEGVGVL